MRFARLLPLFAIATTLFVWSPALADDTSCPAGTVAITAQTRSDATAAGIPTSSNCWDPKSSTTGQGVGEAKAYLAQHATRSVNVACFNAQFAVDLANLMKAVPGGPPTITSGIRSNADQEKARASGASQVGACHSYHQYGLAADFNNASASTLLWMRMNAPQFGLSRIPALSVQTGCSLKGTGFCDPGHIQINGPLPPMNQCGVCGGGGSYLGTLPDTGGSQTDDSRFNTPGNPDYVPYTATPQSGAFSTPLGMYAAPIGSTPISLPPTTPLSTSPTTPTTPTTPATPAQNVCAPSFSCTNNVQYYQTSNCTTQVYQVCSSGCNGTVCAAASSTGNYINNSFGTTSSSSADTDTNTNTNVNTDGNVSDILNSIVTNFSAATVATSSSIAFSLNPDTGEVAQIPTEESPSVSTSGIGVISSVQPTAGGQQTFTSSDFSAQSTLGSQSPSGLASILASMRSALEWAIKVLTPFGGTPRTTY